MTEKIYITPASQLSGEENHRILLVDDFETHLELMTAILEQEGYCVIASGDGKEVLKNIEDLSPDLAILDVMMPGIGGYELCRRLKEVFKKKFFPIILVTGLHQLEDKLTGLEAGADDFFSKPFNPKEITAKIRSLLKLKILQDELEHTEDIIFTLAIAIEAKDNYTKGHSERVSSLSVRLAREIGLSEKEILNVKKGGILHDIGKIGLHEDILHKKEALSQHEIEMIRRHPVTGVEICRPLYSLRQALPAIRAHHERWDGTGFPDGLKGEAIPIAGRIISIADSFDAMVSRRPYRTGFSWADAIGVLQNEKHLGQWDPQLLDIFIKIVCENELAAIYSFQES